MRYSPLLPRRRPLFGRRAPADAIEPAEPTRAERRLAERIVRHLGQRKGR